MFAADPRGGLGTWCPPPASRPQNLPSLLSRHQHAERQHRPNGYLRAALPAGHRSVRLGVLPCVCPAVGQRLPLGEAGGRAYVWWGPQECGHGPSCMRLGQKERAARTSRGPARRATGPGATAPKGGACETVAAELGAGGCAPGLARYEGEGWVSGRGCGGPGPARLYAVPWGWGVRLGGALWSRMLVGGAGRQVRRQMTAWGVKQGLERTGVPAASPGWGGGGFEVPGLGGTLLGTLFTPCPTPALQGPHSQNTWGPDAFSPSPWLPERAPFLEAGPRASGGHPGLGLPLPPTPTPSSGRASWGSGLVTTTCVPKQAAVWSVLWRPRPCTQHSCWG